MILTDATDAAAVYLDDLVANPDNPRQNIGDITELAESIREQGILTPLLVVRNPAIDRPGAHVVRPPCMVVDGHRRLAALRHLGFDDTIPVRVVDMNRTQRLLAALATQGKPLDPLDEARAYQALIDLDLTQRQIAERVGCNQSHVSRRLALLDLDDDTKAAVAEGKTKLRDAEAKARGKEPAAAAPKGPSPQELRQRKINAEVELEISLRHRDELAAENKRLREIAEKARDGLAAVRAEIDRPADEVATLNDVIVELRLEVTELRAAIAELEEEPATDDGPTVAWADLPDVAIFAITRAHAAGLLAEDDPIASAAHAESHRRGHRLLTAEEAAVMPVIESTPEPDDAMFPESERTVVLPPADERLLVDAVVSASAPVPPEWATKQPWGSYDMSAEPRLLNVIGKASKVDTCRWVIEYEHRHDGRAVIIEAAMARIHALGKVAAA